MATPEYIDSARQVIAHPDRDRLLNQGGGGGTFGGMEARVAKLETIAEDTRKTLETIQRQLARVDTKLDGKPDVDKVYKAIFTVYGLSFTIIAAGATVLALLLK
ncbi:hypothetical protein ATER59S_02369 [Aquamicrobium terrae]